MNPVEALYQELILDHGKSPRNRGEIDSANIDQIGHNPLCGDRLRLFVKLDESGKIAQIKFKGEGCAISMASASLMSEAIKGASPEEALQLIETFRQMVMIGNLSAEQTAKLGKLMALQGVSAFPSRVKCATLAWQTLAAGLRQNQHNHPTPAIIASSNTKPTPI